MRALRQIMLRGKITKSVIIILSSREKACSSILPFIYTLDTACHEPSHVSQAHVRHHNLFFLRVEANDPELRFSALCLPPESVAWLPGTFKGNQTVKRNSTESVGAISDPPYRGRPSGCSELQSSIFLPRPSDGKISDNAGISRAIFVHDLPELRELDNLSSPRGPIAEAQALAASLFGARRTWFLVNGSTCGILAAIMACVRQYAISRQGSCKLILPRNAHKSAINGLILSGALPVFLPPVFDVKMQLCHGPSLDGPDGLKAALEGHRDVAAVLLTSPSYHGVCMDLKRAAALCKQHRVPLIVDEAHGAHLGFLTEYRVSTLTALQSGADIVVQSTHKTLSALSQAAMAHVGHDSLLEEKLLDSALQLVQTTSPNYLLLASLDAARWQVAAPAGDGRRLLHQAAQLTSLARQQICEQTPFSVLSQSTYGMECHNCTFAGLDPLRLTIGLGSHDNAYRLEQVLNDQYGVYPELATAQTLTFAFGMGTTKSDVELLVNALTSLARQKQAGTPQQSVSGISTSTLSPFGDIQGLQTPRQAYMAPTEVVPVSGSIIGRTCAETICPYPPGIPILTPGEIISQEALDCLQMVVDSGGFICGCSEPSFKTIRVLCRRKKDT